MMTVDEAWEEYRATKNIAARNVLVEEYLPVVQRISAKNKKRIPQSVDIGEVVSWGVNGLYRAIDNFSPDRGVRFESYAVASIQSAIMDGLRSIDWAPRSLRAKAREIEKARVELEIDLGREPTIAELSGKTDIPANIISNTIFRVEQASHRSLDEGNPDDSDSKYDYVRDDSTDPADRVGMDMLYQAVAKIIEGFPPRTQVILVLYYFEGLKLGDIAKIIGHAESRVSRDHGDAILDLRDQLRSMLSPS